MMERPNRTTWKFSRPTKTLPAHGATTYVPTFAMQTVGTWVGSQVPASIHTMQPIPGAAVVAVDIWAVFDAFTVPFEAIQEGDTATDLERNVVWEAVMVQRFPENTIVGLKTNRGKSTQ